MSRRGTVGACVVSSVALILGCGDSEVEPPSTRESTAQIVEVVNRYFDAVAAQDGPEACEHLTDFGRQILIKVLRGETEGKSPGVRQYDPSECEATVEASAITLGDRTPTIRPSQVELSPSGRSAAVAEQGSTGNQLGLKLVEGSWEIVVPIFTGR